MGSAFHFRYKGILFVFVKHYLHFLYMVNLSVVYYSTLLWSMLERVQKGKENESLSYWLLYCFSFSRTQILIIGSALLILQWIFIWIHLCRSPFLVYLNTAKLALLLSMNTVLTKKTTKRCSEILLFYTSFCHFL